MSEFHPNRTKLVRTKPKVTARRILEAWPLLVWLFMGFLAWRIYSQGVTFTRMNGAVDVYQENIAPIHEGRLLKILVQRGQRVAADTIVAQMDPSEYAADLQGFKEKIIQERRQEVRDLGSDLIKLQAELRSMDVDDAEDSAAMRKLQEFADENEKWRKSVRNAQTFPLTEVERENLLELATTTAKMAAHKINRAVLDKQISDLQQLIANGNADIEKVSKLDVTGDIMKASEQILGSGVLKDNEVEDFAEVRLKFKLCDIYTKRGGTVDLIVKEEGEYVDAGEGILKVVGDPEKLICFLPQDQSEQMKKGDKVWVASTTERGVFYDTTVEQVSPRINNLADSSSPLPNQRVHGRDVILNYPPSSLPDKNEGRYRLLPGQTLIVYTTEPGATGVGDWFNKIFHNDTTVR